MTKKFDRVSDYFLELNNCGVQLLTQVNATRHRKDGRADYHILYISQGACFIQENGTETKIGEGNLILFKPFEEQYYRFCKEDKTVSCYIHFSGIMSEQILADLDISNRVTYVGVSHTLYDIFCQLRDEYVANKPFKKEVCSSLLMRFLSHAARNAKYHSQGIDIKLAKRMNKICQLMENEYAQNRSIDYYAQKCSLSVDRFSHAFKESVGVSPKQYLQKIKVDTACRLLQNIDLSICEVASLVGISDANYFSKLIKRYTGKSPSYFRK